jgi:hypothetical protein
MISKGMDVKKLVNSEVFYPTLWKKKEIYYDNPDTMIVPYNDGIEAIEFEDP